MGVPLSASCAFRFAFRGEHIVKHVTFLINSDFEQFHIRGLKPVPFALLTLVHQQTLRLQQTPRAPAPITNISLARLALSLKPCRLKINLGYRPHSDGVFHILGAFQSAIRNDNGTDTQPASTPADYTCLSSSNCEPNP